MSGIIRAKLKSIREIRYMKPNGDGTYSSDRFYINEEMIRKFGNDRHYEFIQMKNDDYTHEGVDDKYGYHHDWFVAVEEKTNEPLLFDPEELL